jgi:hypothetical protein
MSVFPAGLEPVDDLTPAGWVEAALREWPTGGFRVRDLVPPVFEAYARILHRARNEDERPPRRGTWAQRAVELDRELGPETTWWDLHGKPPYEGDRDPWTPLEGGLDEWETMTLASLLESATSDPRSCWFALWAGWGFLQEGGSAELRSVRGGRIGEWRTRRRAFREARRSLKEVAHHATFELLGRGAGRSYLLVPAALEDADRFWFGGSFQSPTLWWPGDRSWFVHTEIDGLNTYLGGSRTLVDRLVREQILESFEVGEDTRAAL